MSDKVGIAIIGLGRIARTHISGIHLNPDTTRLVAVVDVDEPLAKSTAATYKTRFYTTVEAALTDPEIQAMVICLPHHLHKPVSLQVMETGRHVLTEKPMSTNLEDAQAMVEKAEQKEVVLMTGQCFRFISASLEAKLRMKKEIGEPFNLVYVEGCDFDKNKAPHWWRDTKKTGGMAFTMLGSHTVDLTLWIYEGKKPIRVYAEARSKKPEFEGMDEIVMVISFDDGAIATNHLSLNTSPEKFGGFILGPKGSIEINHYRTDMLGIFSGTLLINGKSVPVDEQDSNNISRQMREFAESILQKRQPMVKNHEILMQLAIIDAAKKSAETLQPVALNDPLY